MNAPSAVRSLLSALRVHTWAFPAILIVGLLQSLSEGVGIGLFIPLLTGIVSDSPVPAQGQWLVTALGGLFSGVPSERRFPILLACVFAAVVATAILSYIHGVLFSWLDGRITHDLRRRIFDQLLAVSFGFIERDRSGRLLNTLTTETWNASEALRLVVYMTVTATTIGVYVLLLLLMSWRLTLIVGVGMLLISGLVRLLSRASRVQGDEMRRINADLTDRMIEGVEGMRVIRAFGQERREQQRFNVSSDQLRRVLLRMATLDSLVFPVHEILAASLLLLTLLLAAPTARDVSVFLVFVFLLYRVQPRVKQFDSARLRLAALSPAVEEVFALVETRDKEYVSSGTVTGPAMDGDIVFSGVSFHYSAADAPALHDCSFTIQAGQTVAFVGPSGSGKSTIVKLLLRFHDPSSGSVTVGDRSLAEFDLQAWRSRIALVSQDVFLFNDTVRENIAYGRVGASRDEVVEAAKRADAHAFIEQLPQQYDTVLGPRGVRLSGGQQQRLSLARAILRDPRILILDEATNALDSISEQWIQDTLDMLRPGRTVIVIAHRLSTVERADQIVVLENGRVDASGSLSTLVDAGGLFARLYHLQNRQPLVPNG